MAHAEEKQFDPAVLGEPGAAELEKLLAKFSKEHMAADTEAKSLLNAGFKDAARVLFQYANVWQRAAENTREALTAARAHAAKPDALVDAAREAKSVLTETNNSLSAIATMLQQRGLGELASILRAGAKKNTDTATILRAALGDGNE